MLLLYAAVKLPAQQETVNAKTVIAGGKYTAENTAMDFIAFFEDIYKVQLHLQREDTLWKGTCVYPSSNTKFYLEGEETDGELLLFEKDSLDNPTGVWLLNIHSEQSTGIWRNNNGTATFKVRLLTPGDLKDFENNSKEEVVFYKGKIYGDKYILTLYTAKELEISTLLNATKNFYIEEATKCIDEECNRFEIITVFYEPLSKLECFKNNAITLKVEAFNAFNSKQVSIFNLMERLEMKDTAFINKDYMFNILYPVFEDKKINNSFNAEIRRIAAKMKNELDSITGDNFDSGDRLKNFAGAWFFVDYYSPRLFSGRFVIQKSYSGETIMIPVVLNLETGKKVNIFEQFKQDFNFVFFAKQYIREHFNDIQGYDASTVRNYLSPRDFKYFTVNNTGILISAGFNTLFGEYNMIIPFEDIKNKIKRRSILHKIVQY